ncbi:hypothetical protein [Bowmanella denitrificans]|uniref:hypothetical protein n=1 Tax=Bowmanella denitrificans TaxID=366582 RepID=UPI000C9CBCCA|nr:hypothetical protein [Bowmanella denitrificans]
MKSELQIKKCQRLIDKLSLNLDNQVVLTECASGGYLYTPIMALLAGAKGVVAYGKTTRFGSFDDNAKLLVDIATKLGLADRLVVTDSIAKVMALADTVDFVTNSGMLRPITPELMSRFKPGAFISLMWEPWEFRPGDIDIEYCQENQIPIVGVNEFGKLLSMENYPFFLFTKAAHHMNSMIANESIALFGGFLTGNLIHEKLNALGIEHIWFTPDGSDGSLSFSEARGLLEKDVLDIVVFAEHLVNTVLVGHRAPLTFQELKAHFPELKVIHICGAIDSEELMASGLNRYPDTISGFGYMSFQPADFSFMPAIELNCIGLKAAEVFGNTYKINNDYEHAIKVAEEAGYALDFPGGFYNYRPRDMEDFSEIQLCEK